MTNTMADDTGLLSRVAIRKPALLSVLAYAAIMLAGALLLTLPALRDAGRSDPVGFIDALFISVSAVSTTGLVTVDPGTTFSFAGELVILLLLQIGGVGYMTVMSFFYILLRDRLSPAQAELTRSGFGLTAGFDMLRFVRRVVAATLLIEAAGAIALLYLFEQAGVNDPLWPAIFHSVSAFCTAGFSLFANSLEDFKGNGAVLLIIAALSYTGALGFVVFVEFYEALFVRPRRISVTTRLVLWTSFWLGLIGTALIWAIDPVIQALPRNQQLSNAFFQAMTASTTVGFNTVPIGAMTPAAIMVLYLLMFVGASPAGTGGGLKSTPPYRACAAPRASAGAATAFPPAASSRRPAHSSRQAASSSRHSSCLT